MQFAGVGQGTSVQLERFLDQVAKGGWSPTAPFRPAFPMPEGDILPEARRLEPKAKTLQDLFLILQKNGAAQLRNGNPVIITKGMMEMVGIQGFTPPMAAKGWWFGKRENGVAFLEAVFAAEVEKEGKKHQFFLVTVTRGTRSTVYRVDLNGTLTHAGTAEAGKIETISITAKEVQEKFKTASDFWVTKLNAGEFDAPFKP